MSKTPKPSDHESERGISSESIRLSDGRRMEIVSDSSNDAFTYMCSHRDVSCKFEISAQVPSQSIQVPSQSAPSQSIQTPSQSIQPTSPQQPHHPISPPLPLPSSPLTHCGNFAISDYIIVTSSLSATCLDRIRIFASRFSVLWMQDFPHQTSLVDATNPGTSVSLPVAQPSARGRSRRKENQRFILVIRSKDGWCKRTVKYLYGLA